MKGFVVMVAALCVLGHAAAARAQLIGLEVQGGVTAFSHPGSLTTQRQDYAASTGWRGLARFGLGPISAGAEMGSLLEESAAPGTHPRYSGVFGAFHPLGLFGVTPYVDAGVGRIRVTRAPGEAASERSAWTYGAGAEFHMSRHFGVNAAVQVIREGKPAVGDVEVAQPPKTLSALVAYRF